MKGLLWIAVAVFSLSELVHGESNPYKEALLAHPWESVHKYVMVRPGAYMFYWLYYADGTSKGAERKPLIIWIQGGPGFAASGLANFAEIGPLTMDMKPRNHTWVKGRNVLLIDHPVGTGFSYVMHNSLLVKTDREMVIDLSNMIKEFFKTHSRFSETPTYIFGQSYGGKICTRLVYCLHNAIQQKDLKMNLKGVGIGSSWINPKEIILTYPDFLYNNGIIDQSTYLKSTDIAKNVAVSLDEENYESATELFNSLWKALYSEAGVSLNFVNILKPSPYPDLDLLRSKVNTYVKPMLSAVNQTLEWNYFSDDAYKALIKNMLFPTTKFLELILNKTDLKVAVYYGNLDATMPLAGASNWVHKLKWNGSEQFKNAKRIQINELNGFYKETKQLSFWGIFDAGHWVPEDNPVAMEQILQYVTSSE